MKKAPQFYRCELCGNLIEKILDSGVTPVCCGQNMTLLTANTVEASYEKHLPVIEHAGNDVTVKVGSVAHPMVPEHYIQWIYLETQNGIQRSLLEAGPLPQAGFALAAGDSVIAAYEYCNLHGLWKTEYKI